MQPMHLNMSLIEPYQLELAKKAIAGDQQALKIYGSNFGYLTQWGNVDRNRALESCKRRVERANGQRGGVTLNEG